VKGYEATGIAEILRETGINSGSLYYFFKTKEALLVAVLDRYVELLDPMVIEPAFATTDDPIKRIFVVLEGYRQMLLVTNCRQGCPIGNLALEMSEKSDVVREKIALNFTHWRNAIQTCLEEAFDRVEPRVDCAQLSSFVLAVMEGAVMQARAYRCIEPFDDAISVLRQHVEGLLMKPAQPGG
jgi:AcrR family transcriptional regulator